MHVDAVAGLVSCIWKVDVAQIVPQHGDIAFIAELAFTGELEPEFAFQAAAAGGRSGGAHSLQSDRLIKKLELSVLASLARVFDSQLVCARPGPPQTCQGGRQS